ncbi:hypothetical protein N7G274_004592 [Stereocaulon virgatum]|uniref:Uncharacterized protein n=1 Tax=Stereocaulon virgatum TaxID=373712 RepID=A0ABR4AAC4_9LECA
MEGRHAPSSSDSTSKPPSASPNPLHGSGVVSDALKPLFTSIFHVLSQRLSSFVQDLVLTTRFAVALNTTWSLAQTSENKAQNSSGFPWKRPCIVLNCIASKSAPPFIEPAKTPDEESSTTPTAPPSISLAKPLCGQSSRLSLSYAAILAGANNNSSAASIAPSGFLRSSGSCALHALEVVHSDAQNDETTQESGDAQDSNRQQEDIIPVVVQDQAPPLLTPIPTPSETTPSSDPPGTPTEADMYDEEGFYGSFYEIPIEEAVRMYRNGARAKNTISMAATMHCDDDTVYLRSKAYQKPLRFRCHRDRGQKARDAHSVTIKVGE